MVWNYRVMRKETGAGEFWYGVYEVYYNDKSGKVNGWTKEAMAPTGESVGDLEGNFKLMRKALYLPILDYKTGKPIKEKRGG